MAFSTGVSLLTSGSFFLKDQLSEFWELTSGNGVGYFSGTVGGSSFGGSSTTGVNGASNDAILLDSTFGSGRSKIDLGSPFKPVGSVQTYCFFCSDGGNPFALRWGSTNFGTGTTNTLGILFTLDTNQLFRMNESAGTSSIQPSLSSAYSSANNGYRFYCITREGVGGSSNTFSFYDSAGSLLGQRTVDATGANTVNFGLLEYSSAGAATVKFDKVAWFNGQLNQSQIVYLYNSGNGRSAADILTSTL